MKFMLFALLALAACQNAKSQFSGGTSGEESDGCSSTVLTGSIEGAPYVVQQIGSTWCLSNRDTGERLIPCDQNLAPEFQLDGLKVLVSGDYPKWTPEPNARYMGRPFKVRSLKKAE